MIDPACLTPEEVVLLKQHYRKTGGSVSHRAHAVLLSSIGKTPYEIAQVLFVEEKTAREWIKAWNRTRMVSLFSQNHGNRNASKLMEHQREEIARALKEVGSTLILALSPQAKGRIERLFETLQDRLIKELALANITTIAAGNTFLRSWIPAFNKRFMVTPASTQAAYRAVPNHRSTL